MPIQSDQIHVFLELPILPGKADELREIARKMVAMNNAEEPGTLVYNVYINPDETLFTYLETYADSEACLFHAKRFSEGVYVGQIVKLTDGARLRFYGNLSAAFKQWALEAGFEPEYFELIDGYVR